MSEECQMYSILKWFEVDMDKNELLKFETRMPLDLYKHFKKQINKLEKVEDTEMNISINKIFLLNF